MACRARLPAMDHWLSGLADERENVSERLFEVPLAHAPVAADEALSAGARRTQRQRADIAAGRHPATRTALADGGQTCGGCAYSIRVQGGRRTYWKCEKVGVTHGPGSDIRISWPACTVWVDRARLATCNTCEGAGRVVNPDRDPKSSTYLRCAACGGRGQVLEGVA